MTVEAWRIQIPGLGRSDAVSIILIAWTDGTFAGVDGRFQGAAMIDTF